MSYQPLSTSDPDLDQHGVPIDTSSADSTPRHSPRSHIINIPSASASHTQRSPDLLHLTILCGDASQQAIDISKIATVRELKQQYSILREHNDTTGTFSGNAFKLLFFYMGKLLSDSEKLLSYGIENGHVIHCHSIAINNNNTSTDPSSAAPETTAPPPGIYYAPPVNSSANDDTDLNDEFYLQSDDMYAQPIVAPEGTVRDFTVGFILGTFVGYLAMICIYQPHIPRLQKFGIMAGVFFNLFMSVNAQSRRRHIESSSSVP